MEAKKTELDQCKANLQRTQETLNQAEGRNAESRRQLQTLQGEADTRRKDLETVTQKCEGFKTQLAEAQKANIGLQEEVDRLTHELEKQSREFDSTVQEFEQKRKLASSQNAELQAQIAEHGPEVQQLTAELEKSKAACAELQSEKDDLEQKCHQLAEAQVQLERDFDTTHAQDEANWKAVAKTAEELKFECEKLRKKNAEFKRNEDTLTQEIVDVTSARDTYKKQYLEMKKLNKTLRAKLESIEEDVRELLRQRETELQDNRRREESEKSRQLVRLEAMRDVQNKIALLKTERIQHPSPYKKP